METDAGLLRYRQAKILAKRAGERHNHLGCELFCKDTFIIAYFQEKSYEERKITMKKFVAFVLAMVMVLCVGLTAAMADCAYHPGEERHYFSGVRLCGTAAMEFRYVVPSCGHVKTENNQRTYVQETTTVGVSDMTNYFVPIAPYNMSKTYGSKWVTPGLLIPIRSDKTVTGITYGLKARGNTDHELNGYSEITISGFFNAR